MALSLIRTHQACTERAYPAHSGPDIAATSTQRKHRARHHVRARQRQMAKDVQAVAPTRCARQCARTYHRERTTRDMAPHATGAMCVPTSIAIGTALTFLLALSQVRPAAAPSSDTALRRHVRDMSLLWVPYIAETPFPARAWGDVATTSTPTRVASSIPTEASTTSEVILSQASTSAPPDPSTPSPETESAHKSFRTGIALAMRSHFRPRASVSRTTGNPVTPAAPTTPEPVVALLRQEAWQQRLALARPFVASGLLDGNNVTAQFAQDLRDALLAKHVTASSDQQQGIDNAVHAWHADLTRPLTVGEMPLVGGSVEDANRIDIDRLRATKATPLDVIRLICRLHDAPMSMFLTHEYRFFSSAIPGALLDEAAVLYQQITYGDGLDPRSTLPFARSQFLGQFAKQVKQLRVGFLLVPESPPAAKKRPWFDGIALRNAENEDVATLARRFRRTNPHVVRVYARSRAEDIADVLPAMDSSPAQWQQGIETLLYMRLSVLAENVDYPFGTPLQSMATIVMRLGPAHHVDPGDLADGKTLLRQFIALEQAWHRAPQWPVDPRLAAAAHLDAATGKGITGEPARGSTLDKLTRSIDTMPAAVSTDEPFRSTVAQADASVMPLTQQEHATTLPPTAVDPRDRLTGRPFDRDAVLAVLRTTFEERLSGYTSLPRFEVRKAAREILTQQFGLTPAELSTRREAIIHLGNPTNPMRVSYAETPVNLFIRSAINNLPVVLKGSIAINNAKQLLDAALSRYVTMMRQLPATRAKALEALRIAGIAASEENVKRVVEYIIQAHTNPKRHIRRPPEWASLADAWRALLEQFMIVRPVRVAVSAASAGDWETLANLFPFVMPTWHVGEGLITRNFTEVQDGVIDLSIDAAMTILMGAGERMLGRSMERAMVEHLRMTPAERASARMLDALSAPMGHAAAAANVAETSLANFATLSSDVLDRLSVHTMSTQAHEGFTPTMQSPSGRRGLPMLRKLSGTTISSFDTESQFELRFIDDVPISADSPSPIAPEADDNLPHHLSTQELRMQTTVGDIKRWLASPYRLSLPDALLCMSDTVSSRHALASPRVSALVSTTTADGARVVARLQQLADRSPTMQAVIARAVLPASGEPWKLEVAKDFKSKVQPDAGRIWLATDDELSCEQYAACRGMTTFVPECAWLHEFLHAVTGLDDPVAGDQRGAIVYLTDRIGFEAGWRYDERIAYRASSLTSSSSSSSRGEAQSTSTRTGSTFAGSRSDSLSVKSHSDLPSISSRSTSRASSLRHDASLESRGNGETQASDMPRSVSEETISRMHDENRYLDELIDRRLALRTPDFAFDTPVAERATVDDGRRLTETLRHTRLLVENGDDAFLAQDFRMPGKTLGVGADLGQVSERLYSKNRLFRFLYHRWISSEPQRTWRVVVAAESEWPGTASGMTDAPWHIDHGSGEIRMHLGATYYQSRSGPRSMTLKHRMIGILTDLVCSRLQIRPVADTTVERGLKVLIENALRQPAYDNVRITSAYARDIAALMPFTTRANRVARIEDLQLRDLYRLLKLA